ncbi:MULTISPECIES: aminotransferase class I/II-fold pyridoxal phosphate-dependent enzyme [Nostocales]|jgi:aspartate/methionine/tyrosine aminotransferase|uniref:Aminotransferase class I/II-fold pyridoxal phosphate-dependent enzyme n=1 Tax=Dolichospermum flos-aquae UHCC 0037 TaxID=2590026 RepID=A0ACC7SAC8_DOLFA|nr:MULTISPECIES: aminotransferase class I/II-fold pyridoxal phosphate-dependent enzyme [Nostocales]MBO1066164.1 aminotransferase class I/II-fold pyridoxal phosphate-dependent enzyme [Anabaena sp. 54]MTJ45360.1 aminotransferase class I/II-fold pyridoxal phosphate-dependent enzyme [Dolichospermum flos-aquae UHCC 0037]
MNQIKFEDLTQHEVQALKHKYNFADAHTHQSQSISQLEIVKRLPELWLESEKIKQEVLNTRFIETFYKVRKIESALMPNNIMLHYAASIATIQVANFLLKKRLTVSLLEPCFDNLYEILMHMEIPLSPLKEELLHEEDKIYENLKNHVKTDAIFIIDPNNPTGFTLLDKKNKQSFENLVRFCKDYDKILIIDYCFANFLMNDEEIELYDTYKILRESGVKYMAIEDTGKTWPIQDAKIAMLKVSDNLYDEMYSIYTAYILNVSPFILNFLTEYIKDSQRYQFTSTKNLLNTNRKIIEEIFDNSILKIQKPKGKVSVAWCEIMEPNLTATELQRILCTGGIYVLPGSYFFWYNPAQGERYIRIALARNTDNFLEGMSLIRQILNQLDTTLSLPSLAIETELSLIRN